VTELIADELNVKKVEFVEDARAFTTYRLKPQMRTVGPKYGKLLGKIGQALAALDGNEVVDAFARGEEIAFDVDGTRVSLGKDDVLTEPMQKPGFVAETDGDMTVVIDTNLNEALIAEGFVREVISKLQNMRKDAGFEVVDRIKVTYDASPRLSALIEEGAEEIKSAVLAISLAPGAKGEAVREWNINGETATLGVER